METNNNKNDLVAEVMEKLDKSVDALIENMLAGKYEVCDKDVIHEFNDHEKSSCTLLSFTLQKKPKKLFHLTFESKKFFDKPECKLSLKEVEIEGQPAENIYYKLSEETFTKVARFFNDGESTGRIIRVVELVDDLNRQIDTIKSVL